MTEEEGAQRHRDQRVLRCQAECERLDALSGDPDARLALGLAWQPLYLAALERDLVDDDCCVCINDYPHSRLLAN